MMDMDMDSPVPDCPGPGSASVTSLPIDTITDENDINLEFEELTYPTDYYVEEENENSTGESDFSPEELFSW